LRVVIHGAGLAGCAAARILAEEGHEVTILEARPHIGGNAYDYEIEEGVFVHKYGPHLFHTNDKEVWNFLGRFTGWIDYKHKVTANTSEGNIKLPIYDKQLTDDVSVTEHYADPYYYDLVYKDYSFKQWGYQPPKEVLDRVMIKCEPQDGYFTDTYQGLPAEGYTAMFKNMVNHPNITVELLADRDIRPDCDLRVWTGMVDEYYKYNKGKLSYRSLTFDLHTKTMDMPSVTVNECTMKEIFTRTTNYSMMHNKGYKIKQSEYPCIYTQGINEPYYPIGDNMYKDSIPNEKCILLGRLAEFKYYDMDKVVAKVLKELRWI